MEIDEREDCPTSPHGMLKFILTHTENSPLGPRLGQLVWSGRSPINTPHYVAATSRGIVPHLSHDTMQKHTSIRGVYVALEDCKLPQYASHHVLLTRGSQRICSRREITSECAHIQHASLSRRISLEKLHSPARDLLVLARPSASSCHTMPCTEYVYGNINIDVSWLQATRTRPIHQIGSETTARYCVWLCRYYHR